MRSASRFFSRPVERTKRATSRSTIGASDPTRQVKRRWRDWRRPKSSTCWISRDRRSVSCVMTVRHSSRSASSVTFPLDSISANMRIDVSGVFSSCDTFETKPDLIFASFTSRVTVRPVQ